MFKEMKRSVDNLGQSVLVQRFLLTADLTGRAGVRLRAWGGASLHPRGSAATPPCGSRRVLIFSVSHIAFPICDLPKPMINMEE